MRKLRFKRQLYVGFIISIVIIVVTAVFFYKNLNRSVNDTNSWMRISVEAISTIDNIELQKNHIGFEIISYVSTSNPVHLRNIQHEQFAISENITVLTSIMQNLDIGTSAITNLQTLLNQYHEEVRITSLAQQGQLDEQALHDLQIENQQITKQLALLKQSIRSKRDIKLNDIHETIEITKYIALGGFGLTVCFLLALIAYIAKTFDIQRRSERIIRKANANLKELSKEREADNWILQGLAMLDDVTRGGLNEKEISANAIQSVCQHLNAKIGVIYLQSPTDDNVFVHTGSYAVNGEHIQQKIMKGQGLIGESLASEKQTVLSNIPDDYLSVTSALGDAKPKHIVIQPFIYEEEVLGILEVAFFRDVDKAVLQFMDRAGITLAVAVKVARTLTKLTDLYAETQQQAEELEAQQEELRTTNDELIHKTQLLEASEEELRVQQEELKHANIELAEKARLLEEHNFSIEQARQSITIKANELERSDKYKSEFLANMSHELRTPLNSILILAKLLEDNKPGNLSAEQTKYAAVIYNAGVDLLNLINNILDLAKIESGKVDLLVEDLQLSAITHDLLDLFSSVAENKTIDFRITVGEGLPQSITNDEQRLKQILKNLLSNAFKFTPEKGRIELNISRADQPPAWQSDKLKALDAKDTIAFSVVDTGIGIPADKQQLIFEAFKQADGSTSRKYGGTGLGLSICSELAALLGGEIQVASQEGMGSTFTLFLPFRHMDDTNDPVLLHDDMHPIEIHDTAKSTPLPKTVGSALPKRLLIIEDDKNFAEILELYAREQGFDTLVAHQGDTGLQMAVEHLPDAIILDIMLPVMDGWSVLRELKNNPDTKDIPVHLMSAAPPDGGHPDEEETIGFLKKPVDKKDLEDVFDYLHQILASPLKKVLVIEDHQIQSDHLKSHFLENGVDVKQAFTGVEAIDYLKSDEHFDCIVLDIELPDRSGMELLKEIKDIENHTDTPVIINTAMELNSEMTSHILQYTKTMVIKSDKSNNRILDEVNLFINRIKNNTSKSTLYTPNGFEPKELQLDKALKGKHILLVDDDMRNIFALSTVFESYNMQVETATNGLEALDALQKNPAIDLVVMDIMMPQMDGYEAIAKIREIKKFAKLPVIAITAKAMQGDRQLVLDAGANDYIAKPVNVNKLLSLIRVWLS